MQDVNGGWISQNREPIDRLRDQLKTRIPGACTIVLKEMVFVVQEDLEVQVINEKA